MDSLTVLFCGSTSLPFLLVLWYGKTPTTSNSLHVIKTFHKNHKPTNQNNPHPPTPPKEREREAGQLKNQPHDHGILEAMSNAANRTVFLWECPPHLSVQCHPMTQAGGQHRSWWEAKKGPLSECITEGKHKQHLHPVSSMIYPQHCLSATQQVERSLAYTQMSSQFHLQNSGTIRAQLIQKTGCSPKTSVFI